MMFADSAITVRDEAVIISSICRSGPSRAGYVSLWVFGFSVRGLWRGGRAWRHRLVEDVEQRPRAVHAAPFRIADRRQHA